MRKNSAVLLAFLMIFVVAASTSAFAGSGCSKTDAKQASKTASGGSGCSKTAAEATTASADGKPCCSKMATEDALAALKTASEESENDKAKAAVQTAELAVQKAEQTTGCSKSKGEAQEAAMVALKEAAEAIGCDKAKAAVETALVAYNAEQETEEQKDPVQ